MNPRKIKSKSSSKDELFSDDFASKKRTKSKTKYNNKKYWLEQEEDDFDESELKDFLRFKEEEE